MADGTHVQDSLAAYALGSLEVDEARQVTEHLATCDTCRAELAVFESLSGLLALGAADAEPSAGVRERLLARAARRPPPAGARVPVGRRPAWAIVGLLVMVALVLSNVLLWQRLMAVPQPGPFDMRAIPLNNTGLSPQASAYVLISADGQNGTVVVDQLTPLDEAQAYQLWLMRAGQSTSGALFTVDETGYRGARILAPDNLLTYTSVQITIEPAAGSAAPTGQPVFAAVLNQP